MKRWFDAFSTWCAFWMGHAAAFAVAVAVCVIWAITGPIFAYSDTWQLIINTGTTVLTFLAVFVIQHTQNRDTLAINAKLDELVLSNAGARNELAGVEEKSEDEIRELKPDD